MRFAVAAVLAIGLLACGSRPPDRVRLEQEFAQMLTGATLEGRFTSRNSDRLIEDRYEIHGVSRLTGDLWTINTRIKYGDHDVTVPVPVRVVWAGDTPMITLTDATIPGLGSFTARVLFYRGEYAGTWSSSKGHGGQMFGRLTRPGDGAKQ